MNFDQFPFFIYLRQLFPYVYMGLFLFDIKIKIKWSMPLAFGKMWRSLRAASHDKTVDILEKLSLVHFEGPCLALSECLYLWRRSRCEASLYSSGWRLKIAEQLILWLCLRNGAMSSLEDVKHLEK